MENRTKARTAISGAGVFVYLIPNVFYLVFL